MNVESLKERRSTSSFPTTRQVEQDRSYLDVDRESRVMSRSWHWPGRSRRFVVYYDARSKDLEACLEKEKVRTSIWRDVRTLAIEEAYTTKYSIHPGADTMLCGFRLTNRWLSMKKDIASCGSKYLAYLEVEVEYQGSSGLLLQPELPE
ncbi:hypothetical protein Tco_1493662 [Tanacetum coccineum]